MKWNCASSRGVAAHLVPIRSKLFLLNAPTPAKLSWQSDATIPIWTGSLTYLPREGRHVIPLTQYGRMAESHWREHCPKLVRELERKGILNQMLLEAEEKTKIEMAELRIQLMQRGSTAQQAHDQAWEMVRERYILLPPES
ncbi:MAG: hypothetical protein U1G07_22270 [Verrucomicrobiota bacterium]